MRVCQPVNTLSRPLTVAWQQTSPPSLPHPCHTPIHHFTHLSVVTIGSETLTDICKMLAGTLIAVWRTTRSAAHQRVRLNVFCRNLFNSFGTFYYISLPHTPIPLIFISFASFFSRGFKPFSFCKLFVVSLVYSRRWQPSSSLPTYSATFSNFSPLRLHGCSLHLPPPFSQPRTCWWRSRGRGFYSGSNSTN